MENIEETIVIISGFFDPIGIQHLVLIEKASKLGNKVICGVNSDESAIMKKGQFPFMPFKDRVKICSCLKFVDEAVGFEDDDIGSACYLIRDVYNKYKERVDSGKVKIIFANGGDRSNTSETPEYKYIHDKLDDKVEMLYGIGGYHKTASSSQYLREWVNSTCIRYNINFKLEGKY